MWTRRELKAKAKETLRLNYWKTVLIALVFTLVCSGAGEFGVATGSGRPQGDTQNTIEVSQDITDAEVEEMLEQVNEIDYTDIDNPPIDETTHLFDLSRGGEDGESIVGEVFGMPVDIPIAALFAATGVLLVVVVVVLAIALTISAFLANPVEIGTARFFTRNLNQRAEVKEVAYGFDHNYLESVKTMFWRDIRIILWGMLFIVPGIVKAYEYRMIPYLLADDPTMTKDEAFAESKRMMYGNKWRACLLDLSFIGWWLLAIPTLGLVTIFYASPYKKMTDAALYEALRYGDPQAGERVTSPETAGDATPVASVPVPVPPFAAADAPVPVWDDEIATTGEGADDYELADVDEAPSSGEPTGTDGLADSAETPADPIVPTDPQA